MLADKIVALAQHIFDMRSILNAVHPQLRTVDFSYGQNERVLLLRDDIIQNEFSLD